ncbi:terminase large subunit domain-containing protein [Vibrio owensii]|uniref:terminase large subunit domain-containing protein n=1 Tax=Vibrio owensii TaxID=696485 RepID=UPI00406878BA
MIHDLSHLTYQEKLELIDLLEKEEEQRQYDLKYNRLKHFKPYPYQSKFYKAGANKRQRFLMAANRIGKTFGTAYEVALHLTGRYPDDWKGKRFNKPILAWAVGTTGDQVKDVLQKELFGTQTVKDEKSIGTGAIPRDCIEMDMLVKDGHRITGATIKHVSGGTSTLTFKSTAQGEHVMMGSTVDLIWLDEEDKHKSTEIYSQCLTRTGTTNGHILFTATPENGKTSIIQQFQDDETGRLYLQNATWDDAPHLSEEDKAELLAGIPSWQRDMRSKGIPMLGSGLVFEFDPYTKAKELQINDVDEVLWSLDIGWTTDATALSLMCRKTDGTIFIAQQWYLEEDEEGNNIRGAKYVAEIINDSYYPNAPLIRPSDASFNADSGGAYGKELRDLGVNILTDSAYNPSSESSDGWGMSTGAKSCVTTGLTNMNKYFRMDKFFIDPSCQELLKEMGGYYAEPKNGGGIKYGGTRHGIDSLRYGFISLIGGRGQQAYQCIKQQVVIHQEDTEEYYEY